MELSCECRRTGLNDSVGCRKAVAGNDLEACTVAIDRRLDHSEVCWETILATLAPELLGRRNREDNWLRRRLDNIGYMRARKLDCEPRIADAAWGHVSVAVPRRSEVILNLK